LAREHQVVAAEERRRIVEHLEGPERERHAVLARRPSSISVQRAPRTSAEHAAVRTRNSKASTVPG